MPKPGSEQEELELIAMDIITKTLTRVDADMERAVTPRTRAQLRSAKALAIEAGLLKGDTKGDGPMAQRDLLKKISRRL